MYVYMCIHIFKRLIKIWLFLGIFKSYLFENKEKKNRSIDDKYWYSKMTCLEINFRYVWLTCVTTHHKSSDSRFFFFLLLIYYNYSFWIVRRNIINSLNKMNGISSMPVKQWKYKFLANKKKYTLIKSNKRRSVAEMKKIN